ncbi:MAG: multifunctional CCA addition/repair protein [Candidatus Nitrotoga sp.]|jgi:tRNA nucleotidyltransferase (CCA-adding enzyme)|nr:multifunctional CCA addition/repair protein [Candidatus Nitrotoga sp.]MBP0118584.1 multifunctional CCA addition/repair protein [Candidatus Nitrotoga sp.]
MKDSDLEVYSVGGAVRDDLLGLPVNDRDWVVVGSTPEAMIARGYKPVGKDFPVFLNPSTHEEYALARTERKTKSGYRGFAINASPEVTLSQDLLRRDFTINAIARDMDGRLIDPHNGITDLRAGILRHVSPAFSEDPVRILRAARFVARFGFSVSPETLALMREMVKGGEVDALVPERTWQELTRGLMEKNPSRFFTTLRNCGALARALPEIDALFNTSMTPEKNNGVNYGTHAMLALDDAAQHRHPLAVRFSVLAHNVAHIKGDADLLRTMCLRLRATNECRDLGLLMAHYYSEIQRVLELGHDSIIDLLQNCDAWRRPQRFTHLLQACASNARTLSEVSQKDYPQADHLLRVLAATQAVDVKTIAQQCPDKGLIAEKIRKARAAAAEQAITKRASHK